MKKLMLTIILSLITAPALAASLNKQLADRIQDHYTHEFGSPIQNVKVRMPYDPVLHLAEAVLDTANFMLSTPSTGYEIGYTEIRIVNFDWHAWENHDPIKVKCTVYINESRNHIQFDRCNEDRYNKVLFALNPDLDIEAGHCADCSNY